jgi:polyisoprenoid-binding protein YceI
MKKIILFIISGSIILVGSWLLYNKYRVIIPPVDISRSEVGWSGKSITGGHAGKLNLSRAEIQIKAGELIGGVFEADMRSITCTDITDTAENRSFMEHIANEDFFEVNKYPTAFFQITQVKKIDSDQYEVTGKMKIKEKDNIVSFTAKVESIKEGKRFSALINIDRTQFGIEYAAKGKPGSEKDWFILNDFTLNVNIVTGAL